MRRAVGLSGLQKKKENEAKLREVGNNMAIINSKDMQEQVAIFKGHLERFARLHSGDLGKNPILRTKFQRMCTAIGVDPLYSSKGYWSQFLGTLSDWYWELAIQVVETCLIYSDNNGGLTDLHLVHDRILRKRKTTTKEITMDDIVKSVETLKPLCSGYKIISLKDGKMAIQSIPLQLSKDSIDLLGRTEQLGNEGYFTNAHVEDWGWSLIRMERAIEPMLEEGILWVDNCPLAGLKYWFSCLFDKFK